MKKLTVLIILSYAYNVAAQNTLTVDSAGASSWSFRAAAHNYFFKGGDYIFSPVVAANHNWLHLEARYNYEDIESLSLFGGYNFSTGNKLVLEITPMIGFASGNSSGIIPATELTLTYKDFELYNECEYLFDIEDKSNNFFYTWSELNYYPLDWLYFGLAGARTRLYQTDLEYQRGFSAGISKGIFSATGYFLNWGFDEPYYLVTLSATIE